jgi:protocatechuate 3,4-dioxygenase beta subunit
MLSASTHSTVAVAVLGLAALGFSGCQCRGGAQAPAGSADAQGSADRPPPRAPVNFAGIVQDRRGVPLPDVLVIAWPKGRRGEAVAQARSGEDGRFLLPGLRPDRWKLLVEAGGLGTLETERQVPEDGQAVLALDGESRSVTGVVTDGAGRPQVDAQVSLGGAGLRWTRTAKSDVNGIFAVTGLGSGRFTLRATHGARASPPTVVTIDEAALRPVHVRLSLQPGVFVEGRVVDDTGKVVVDAAVDVMALPSDDLPVSGRSGLDGRFRLGPVAPGKHQVLARLEDHVPLDVPEPQLGARARESFELRLARTARVSGRVLDEAGQAMVGVLVYSICLIGGRDDLIVLPGVLPSAAEAAELPVGRLLRPGGVRSSPTDKQGRFSLTGLSPGRTRLEIQHPDKLPLRREPLLLAPGDVRDLGDLTMLTGATLAGKVFDDEARPADGALVEARLAGKTPHPPVRTTTDAAGAFFLRVPRGDYLLTAQTEKLVSANPATVRVHTAETSIACELRLVPRAGLRR